MDPNNKKDQKNNQNRNRNMRGVVTLIIWALVLTVVFNYINAYSNNLTKRASSHEIPYSQLIDLIQEDQVAELKIENGVIKDVKFLTFGCGAAIATSSMATDLIKGKTVDEALKLTNKAVVEALEGLPPVKVHCSVLAEQAVKAALSDYYRRQGIDPEPIVGKLEEDCEHCESCGN